VSGPLGAETITIRAAVARDGRGDPITPASPALPLQVIHGCAVYPRGASTETEFRASTVVDGITVLIPGRYDVASTSQIEWDGVVYDVVGDPGIWTHLGGQVAGTQVNCKVGRG
jgi:hypothetical protein